MKKVDLKNRKSASIGAVTGLVLMIAVSLLLTNCSTRRQTYGTYSGNTSGVVNSPNLLQDDCALLHIYRSGSMMGAAIGYDLYLGNEMIFRVKNKSKTTIEVTREGRYILSAKTETRTEVPIDIQFGHEYYVRCGLKMGALVGRPDIEIVGSRTVKPEFDKIPAKR